MKLNACTDSQTMTSLELAELFGLPHHAMMKEIKTAIDCCDDPYAVDEYIDERGKKQRFFIVPAENLPTLFAELFTRDGGRYWLAHDALTKIVTRYLEKEDAIAEPF